MAAFAHPNVNKEGASDVLEPKLCSPRDVIFVLDSSGSISDEDFDRALMFTRRIVGLLDISQTRTRVAMVNYGTKAKVEFSLHHINQEKEVQRFGFYTFSLFYSMLFMTTVEVSSFSCSACHSNNTSSACVCLLTRLC